MLQAPTGAGKTTLAAAIIDLARAKGRRVIFTVPSIPLIDQTVRAFWDEGIREVGVIQAAHPMTDPSRPVQVASVQTLQKREIPEADLVIVDEAHRTFQFLTDWMGREAWASVPFIGLSATPWTKGLGRLYDRLIVAATTQELIDAEFLSPFRVFAPAHPDLTGVRTVAGDYHEGDLAKAMGKGALVADIVSTWQRLGENRPTLCFGVDRLHAQTIQVQFERAGVSCGYMDATTTPADRDAIRKRFASGDLKVVCNVGVLTTGVDWDVRCVIMARPTKSEILYTQIVGRGLRTAPGKDHLIILDHSDTTLKLGFVTDINHDRLDGGNMSQGGEAKEREKPKPMECPECSYVRAPSVRACPSCGHVPVMVSRVETLNGELQDLAAQRKANREDWAEKIAFMAQLKAYAIQTGKKDGWCAHKYKAKFGVWPNDPRVKNARAAAGISPEVRSWITAQNIRFAKSRGAAA